MAKTGLSNQLQIGKAGEHLVCCDLIRQSYNAFLADQGLPYDVVVDINGRLLRIQVKTTLVCKDYGTSKNVYRFGLRKARGHVRVLKMDSIDVLAFVALDSMQVAYMSSKSLANENGYLKMCVEFKSNLVEYEGREYSNGTIRKPYGKFINQFPFDKISK